MKLKIVVALLSVMASLCAEPKILALAGSTRKGSFNQKLAKEAAEIARKKGATVTYIDLKDYPIPLYDGDLEAERGMPQKAKEIRDMMIASDGIIISTPEYNGSVSGTLKNTIDWLSRAEKGGFSLEAFKGKSFALMSASVSRRGGKAALDHLAYIIEHIEGKVVPTKVAVPDAHEAFDNDGNLKDPALKKSLEKEIQELMRFIK